MPAAQDSLFDLPTPATAGEPKPPSQPLAERMRPRRLDEVAGQAHLLAPGRPLRAALEQGRVHSMILWGPPGVGKTTLARLLAQAVDAEFIALMKKNGAVYCPTLTVPDGYSRMYDAVRSGLPPPVDDPNRVVDSLTYARVLSSALIDSARVRGRGAASQARATRWRLGLENLLRVQRAGIPVAMGTDAGNPLTLHGPAVYAEMDAMREAGLNTMEVLVASTRNGARAMGRSRDFGTVEPGKAADLVILGADPLKDVRHWRRVRYVVRGGVIRPIEEFRQRP